MLEFVTATDEKGYWAVTLVARFIAPDIGFRQLRDGPWERSLADAWEAFMRSVEAKWTRMFHGTREAVEVEEDIVEVKEDEPEE